MGKEAKKWMSFGYLGLAVSQSGEASRLGGLGNPSRRNGSKAIRLDKWNWRKEKGSGELRREAVEKEKTEQA